MAIKGGDPILEKQNWSPWFFGLCAFLFFSYGVAIYQELVSRRTYIWYQSRFKDFEREKTEVEFAEFKAKFDAGKEAELKKAHDAAQEKLESSEYRTLEKDQHRQYIQTGFVKAERSKVKSNQDAQFYNWKSALHRGDADDSKYEEAEYWRLDVSLLGEKSAAPAEYKARFLKEMADEKEIDWDTKLAAEEKKLADLDAQLAAMRKPATEAEKALADHRAGYVAFEERLEKIEGRSIRNIDQIVNDKLGIGGAYTFGTVDRCRSCHVAVDRPGFDQTLFAGLSGELEEYKKYDKVFSTHPNIDPLFTKHAVDTIGCTVCHQGQGRATRIKTDYPWQNPDDFVFVHDKDQPHGPAADHGAHQWEYPVMRGDFVQSNCQRCHQTQRWLDGAPAYEKGKDLFLEKGCVGCHTIKGFEEMPRVAPELTRIKSKVTADWLVQWIQNPKAFYPNTRMPAFVFDEYAPGHETDPSQNVTKIDPAKQKEVATKIAAYLWQSSTAPAEMPFGKFPGGGNAADGLKVIETVGCLGCHSVGTKGTGQAPPLDKAGAKMASADWIWNWIRQPRWHAPTTTMPSLRLTDGEARDVTAWLWQAGQQARVNQSGETVKLLEDPKAAEEGGRLIAQWGCAGCHVIPNHQKDGRIGPELTLFGEKKPFELAFGDTGMKEDWLLWTRGKLQNPRQYVDVRSAARMPWFGLTDEEIHALTVYLAGQKNLRVPKELQKDFTTGRNATVERGRTLVNQYNCVGCHTIEGRGGLVREVIGNDRHSPPNLNAEGLKIQSDWLLDFLKSPTPIRQWLKIRMPTFPLSDDERQAIVAYFRAVDGVEGAFDIVNVAALDAKLIGEGSKLVRTNAEGGKGCQGCHPINGAGLSAIPEASLGPDLGNVWRRFRPAGVKAWVEAPQRAMPGTNMPGVFFDYDPKTGKLDPLVYKDGKPDPDTAYHQIDAISAYLFSLGAGRSGS